MDLEVARTPKTLCPFQFMTFPPEFSILSSSSGLSGCANTGTWSTESIPFQNQRHLLGTSKCRSREVEYQVNSSLSYTQIRDFNLMVLALITRSAKGYINH
ncbi:hypothetical protein H5410_017027 [Solanum commersonii]|uniref:Uncharacterized protein n=1 Tax=Solanum commersonii TaxID=4109 RepID=A0A9J5ZYQ6_SOLCO|nr:hypothetical protein H5410_017027 [Solanum commersonii]